MVETLLIACDFDGTITERDTLHVIVEDVRHPRRSGGPSSRACGAGEVTLEQAMQEEFADGARDARRRCASWCSRGAGLRAGFPELVELGRGEPATG